MRSDSPGTPIEGEETGQPWGRHAHYALALLFIVSVFSIVDRYILSILLEPIKTELQVSDAAMGFLAGMAFAIFNAAAAIPLARLSDRYSRRTIIVIGLASWSVLTALQGAARNFGTLALARIGVGIGEAATAPAAHSLISDFYPPHKRATAIAVFNTGGHVGVLFGLSVGGLLYEWLGWRMTMVAVGLPGLLLAALVYKTMHEPERGSEGMRRALKQTTEAAQPADDFRAAFRALFARRSFRHMALTLPFFVMVNYVVNIWGAVFLMRVHGWSVGEVGVALGLTVGLSGTLGNLLGGYLCDRAGARDVRYYLWLPAGAAALVIPLYLCFAFWPGPVGALVFLACAIFLISSHISPIYAMAQGVASPRRRATASAIIHVMSAMLAAGIGPFMVGWLNDQLVPLYGDTAIRYSLCLVIPVILVGIYNALRAAQYLPHDIATARGDLA